jgi:uncharacterized protein involved in outer membrane biogenesis
VKRRWLKWLGIAAAAMLLLLVVAAILINPLIKGLALKRIEQSTGVKAAIKRLSVKLFPPGVHVQGFRLMNPPGFGHEPLLELPELALTVDREAAREGRLKIHDLRLNLAAVNVVVNEAGERNLDVLRRHVDAQRERDTARRGTNAPPKKPPPELAGIDRFELSLGEARLTDLRTPVVTRALRFGWTNQVMTNIVSRDDLNARLLLLLLSQGATIDGERSKDGFGVFETLGLIFGPLGGR